LKEELINLIEENERRLNELVRLIYEQKSDSALREKINRELNNLKQSSQSALAKFSTLKHELKRKIIFEFDANGSLDSLRRNLNAQKRALQKLKREIHTGWYEPLQVKILGIGEITTTIELKGQGAPLKKKPGENRWIRMAIKKAPSFPNKESAEGYIKICYEYENFLSNALGIQTPYAEHRLMPGKEGRWLVYNFQERLRSESIACLIIQVARLEEIEKILLRLLAEIRKIFLWNHAHPEYQIGFDAQIPNWAFIRFGPEHPVIEETEPLIYLDTSTPLIRRNGIEQLDTEIFLKSIPLFLRPVIRRTLLKEVLDRYYRPRDVILDLLASFITHHRPDLLPGMIELTNQWLNDKASELQIAPYTVKEIKSYNRQDVLIWKFFRQMKRLDRFFTEKILGKTYEQRLPKGSPLNWENLVGAGGKGLTVPDSLRALLKK